MRNKAIYVIFAIAMIAVMLAPVNAWSYGNPAKGTDGIVEKFGPRADRMLIKLYASEISEWDTGLETNEIDMTDWPLDEAHYTKYTTAPWDEQIKVMGYGAEFGLYLFDLNNNNNLYLGNPEDTDYPNPVYPNPMSDLDLRKAVAYLTNRPKIVSNIGNLVAVALYTPVPLSAGKYSHADIQPGGAREDLCYLYNPVAAAAVLEAGGFPLEGSPDGWRYWDKDGDKVYDGTNENMPAGGLKIVARVDSPARDFAGTDVYNELMAIKVFCTLLHMPSGAARTQVMAAKNFHIYTGGWSLTVDPDSLILWNWDFYWHPGNPYNYGGCNNEDFNEASYGVMYANDQSEAVFWALAAQIAYATDVLSVPLYTSTGNKAAKRTYTGTPGVPDAEDSYEGKYWEGFVNVMGYGPDNGWSFTNMHPEGVVRSTKTSVEGDGSMTVRWGFKTQEIKTLNPVYAEWLWDNNVIDSIGFDSLCVRNPYNLGQFLPWIALQWSVGSYTHPVYGTCTKVVFTLRPGIEWSDGTPLTVADIYFTYVELAAILSSRGLPNPWWISNVMNILSFSILDPLNFEVLLDVKTVFAVGWIGGNRILPKHIWKPIATSGDPTTFAPDPNMINSGAWRIAEYLANSHVLLTCNSPGKTVGGGVNSVPGSVPVTSHNGHFRFYPVQAEYWDEPSYYYTKLDERGATRNFNFTLRNEATTTMNVSYVITGEFPNGTSISGLPAANNVSIAYGAPLELSWGYYYRYGLWRWHILIEVWWQCPFCGTWHYWRMYWCLWRYWITIKEDIAGSTWYDDVGLATYPYKSELVSPDIKVDIKDIARASGAFGSYPGHIKWNTVADITGDYKIDIKDLARISAKFGWHG